MPFLANFTDVPLEFGSLLRSARNLAMSFVSPSAYCFFVEVTVEHVVLALMPHHALRGDSERQQACPTRASDSRNELERSGVELLPLVRRIRIPVIGDGCPTDGRFDDGDRELSLLLPDSSSKITSGPNET